jgi:hypothetical protein
LARTLFQRQEAPYFADAQRHNEAGDKGHRSEPAYGGVLVVNEAFLLAALADIYSGVEKFVIVEGGPERIYVGMISPRDLRKSLATQFPEFEATYQNVQRNAIGKLGLQCSSADLVDEIVEQWTMSQFNRNGNVLSEEQVNTLVTSQRLSSWLSAGGGKLETDYLKWDGGPDSALLNYMVVCRSSAYVPLVRERRLEKVADRVDLAVRVAESALRRHRS